MSVNALRANRPTVISEHIDGETVMINLETGNYYSLNGGAARIWALIDGAESVTVDQLIAGLRQQGVDEPALPAQVTAFVDELSQERLVVSSAPGSAANGDGEGQDGTAAGTADPGPWSAPSLARFTDMQDLLVLDPVHEVDDRGWPHLPDTAEG